MLRANRRPLTWPGPVGGCSLAMMVLSGAWIEWRRVEAGTWDPWFGGAMALGFLCLFGAAGLQGAPHRWAVRAAAYLLILPPVALFAAATARAAGWL